MHTKNPTSLEIHKFEEERARRLLIYCFPDKYSTAQLSESPDIIVPSLSIGVEVTASMRQEIQQNLSIIRDITGKQTDELSKLSKKLIESGWINALQGQDDRWMATFTEWGNMHDLVLAYEKKTEKLNDGHFNVFNENNLFIFAWMIDNVELEEQILGILQHSTDESFKKLQHHFNNIYVFVEDSLFTVVPEGHLILSNPISADVMTETSEQSFIKVFGMSRKQYNSK